MSIDKLKQIGAMQDVFMFVVSIPVFPVTGQNDFEFLVRSTTIPGYNRNKNLIRYLNRQYTLAGGKEHDAEWTVTILLDQTYATFKNMVKWFKYVDESNGDPTLYKAEAYVKLLGLDETSVTHRFKYTGLYPLNIPSLDSLSNDESESHVTLEYMFAYDDIDYDENDSLTF